MPSHALGIELEITHVGFHVPAVLLCCLAQSLIVPLKTGRVDEPLAMNALHSYGLLIHMWVGVFIPEAGVVFVELVRDVEKSKLVRTELLHHTALLRCSS